MNAFEDLGFFCIDNLPVTMISPFVRLMSPNEEGIVPIPKAALVIDIRERHFLADFAKEINKVKKKRLEPTVVFLEASEEVLMRRFSETRRPHPAERGKGLRDAVRQERKAMAAVREKADLIIDTSEHSVHTLRREILRRFGDAGVRPELLVQIMSFGHKYGTPRDVDLQFDVRHLPNPYFVSGLREKTGADRAVVKFLREQAEVSETIDRFSDLLPDDSGGMHRRKASLGDGRQRTGPDHREGRIQNFGLAPRYAKIALWKELAASLSRTARWQMSYFRQRKPS